MGAQEMTTTAHILAIPLPLQGHINPMVQLCKRLVAKGIRVTLLIPASTIANLQLQKDTALINIETVPDCTINETEHLDIYQIFFQSLRATITNGLPNIFQKYKDNGLPIKAILYDSILPWIPDLAHEQGLKAAVLFTQPCSVCSIFYHLHNGSLKVPLDDEVSEVSLPGLPVLRLKELPYFVYEPNAYPHLLKLMIDQFSTFEKADWRLFNTFDKLEDEILRWMANKHPILTIGPTVPSMCTDKRLHDNYNYGLSLFTPNSESCIIKWLDKKQDHSVIYVAFGSVANHGEKQMEELSQALIDSHCSFIWVVREPKESKIPQDLVSDLQEKGLIVNWCPQLDVLSHRAVGCFITHCGWNSTFEALCLGVPMISMPQWTDQPTNAKFIEDVWKIGVRVKADENGIFGREEIGASVEDVMKGERGHEIRRNVMNVKRLAIESISEGGSSDKNIANFVDELISS